MREDEARRRSFGGLESNNKINQAELKSRLINGIQTKFTTEKQKNFLAPIQKRPGYKTCLPGVRLGYTDKPKIDIFNSPRNQYEKLNAVSPKVDLQPFKTLNNHTLR